MLSSNGRLLNGGGGILTAKLANHHTQMVTEHARIMEKRGIEVMIKITWFGHLHP